MRTMGLYVAAAGIALLAGCGRTKDGDLTVDRPGDVDIKMKTDTLHLPAAPDIDVGSKKDTVVVDKPVVGVKKDTMVISRPTVTVKKKGGG